MVEVAAREHRRAARTRGEQTHERRGEALRKCGGKARRDAHDLHGRHRSDRFQHRRDALVGQRQRIAAGEQDVLHLRIRAEPLRDGGKLRVRDRRHGRAGKRLPETVAAEGRAGRADENDGAVGVAAHETRHGRAGRFAERVERGPRRLGEFAGRGQALPQDRVVRRGVAHERKVVRRRGHGEALFRFAHLRRDFETGEDARKRVERTHRRAQLRAPGPVSVRRRLFRRPGRADARPGRGGARAVGESAWLVGDHGKTGPVWIRLAPSAQKNTRKPGKHGRSAGARGERAGPWPGPLEKAPNSRAIFI